ncbi:hypothetical protein ACFV0T_15135 [Streptomyces sp. NPDC059582]|uniref:hypothetical protein n=1 Tax=Streptomyces sp. NPDC059582 TaxID=3346875 RepID=UPI00368C8D4B
MPEETADAVRQAAQHVADALAALETEKDRRDARRWLRDAVSRLREVFAEADPPRAEHEVGLQNLIAQLSILELAVTRAHGRPAAGPSVRAAADEGTTAVDPSRSSRQIPPTKDSEAVPGTSPATAPGANTTPGTPTESTPPTDSTPATPLATVPPVDATRPPGSVTAPMPVETPSPPPSPSPSEVSASVVVGAPQRPKVPPRVPGPGTGASTTAATSEQDRGPTGLRTAEDRGLGEVWSAEDRREAELRTAVETWWPRKPAPSGGGIGFRPEIPDLLHEVAKERIAGAGTLEGLARGLRLDTLRIPAEAARSPLGDLDRVLGSHASGDSLLPGWGEVLPALGDRNSPHEALEDLPSLWRELERVAADGQDAVPDGSAPHTVSPEEVEALRWLARRALDLAAVVQESTLVGCSGLAFIDAPGADRGVHPLAAKTEFWKRRFNSCVRNLRQHSWNRAEGSEREAYLTALIQFDEVLAQIVPDPVPHADSWWQRQRAESAVRLRTLLKAQGADHRGGFVKYEIKENFKGLVQDEIHVRKRGDTAEVLWWLRLPYVVNEGDTTTLSGRAILTPRDKR